MEALFLSRSRLIQAAKDRSISREESKAIFAAIDAINAKLDAFPEWELRQLDNAIAQRDQDTTIDLVTLWSEVFDNLQACRRFNAPYERLDRSTLGSDHLSLAILNNDQCMHEHSKQLKYLESLMAADRSFGGIPS